MAVLKVVNGTDAQATRQPPNNLQVEESLLGAMLLARSAIEDAVEIVEAGHFYSPAHAHIAAAIFRLYGAGSPVDPLTVADELTRNGLLESVGGDAALVGLQTNAPALSNAARYARIIEETALLRKMIGVAGEVAEMGYSWPIDVRETVATAESLMWELGQGKDQRALVTSREMLETTLQRLEELYDRGTSITGISSGYLDLDELLSGFQPSTLNLVGARPAMGKTAWAIGLATHVVLEEQRPVLFFSLEMGQFELGQRFLAGVGRVDSRRLKSGRLVEQDWERIVEATDRFATAPLLIEDNPYVTLMDIRSKCRRLKSQLGDLGIVIIDYIQLMTGHHGAETRQVEVSQISRGLKVLARELETPIVALAQLNRDLEKRADKRPMLSDLRESGCLPASTRITRADNGEEITIGELVLTQQQPLVWSVDERQRLVPAQLVKTFPSGIKPVFELRLASGRSVNATANHPFLTIEGWTRLDALHPGEFVAVPRQVPKPIEPPDDVWSDDELVLLAHMLGDGSMGPGFKYTTADPYNKKVVEDVALGLFGIKVGGPKRGSTWQLWFPSPYRLTHKTYHPMRDWLEPHGLWKSRSWTKFVPQSVFGLSDRKVALFLHHLWATDGSITTGRNIRGRYVASYYSTTSRQFALDVQRLLLRFGIRTAIGKGAKERKDGGTYRPGYSVRIQGAATQAHFLRTIGCFGQRGECIPEALEILDQIKENPNVDLVPWPISREVKMAMTTSGVTHRQLSAALDELYCGSYFLGSETRPRRFSRDRLRRMGEMIGSQRLVDVATSDLYWDEVIEVVPLGDQPTFDATIQGTHNFIADGVVVHNSLEADSDTVSFIYRDEVYDPNTSDGGIAEVIVAKHRAGPTGLVRLAWLPQYTRFANMARS